MITILGVTVVLGVLLVARYGADSRSTGDPTGRDAAWPRSPRRAHTPAADVRTLAALTSSVGRRVAAHRRAWELFDGAQRPWEGDPAATRPAPARRAARTAPARTAPTHTAPTHTAPAVTPAHLAVPAPRPTGERPCPRAA